MVIKHGRVIDPSQKLDRVTNVLMEDGRVAGYDVPDKRRPTFIDATGKIVRPG